METKKFIKFPSIDQFRNTVKDVQYTAQYVGKDGDNNPIMDRNAEMPTLKFKGTVKLHGTNAGVCYNDIDGIWFQSRRNIITSEKDNAGFAFFCESRKEVFTEIMYTISSQYQISTTENTISIFGEWCGGNIQKGVALAELEKMFIIFGVKITPHDEKIPAYWVDEGIELYNQESKVYNINEFPTYEIDIDFNEPKEIQNQLIDLTNKVEECCPVGKQFNVCGIGEGIVWEHKSEFGHYRFKVKGEKHSSSKVKKLAEVDVERLNSINEFVDYVITENRLYQGIEQVFTLNNEEPDIKKTGDFIRWIMNDIIKEESDTLVENGLEPKDIGGAASKKASKWFREYLDSNM